MCTMLRNAPEKWRMAVSPKVDANPEDQALMWRQAMEEVERGWLEPPRPASNFDWANTVPCVRFALQQGDKVRCCDDLKRSGTNAAARPLACVDLPSVLTLAQVATLLGEKKGGGPNETKFLEGGPLRRL